MTPRRALVLGALLLLAGPAAPAPAQTPRAERPTYTVGDRWLRSDGAYELARVERGRYVFVAPGGREIHLSQDLVIVKAVEGGSVQWELDPAPRLGWPLEVGKFGVAFVTLRAPAESGLEVRFIWKVEAWEEIAVAGVRVRAFRIALSTESVNRAVAQSRPEGRERHYTVWYAPELGRLVKLDGPRLAFTLAAPPGAPAPAAVAAAPPPAPSSATAPSVAVRPTYAVGDRWLRNDGAYELARVEKDRYVYVAPGGREVHLSRDLAIVRTMRNGTVEWEFDPAPRLAWPLAVGRTGEDGVAVQHGRYDYALGGGGACRQDLVLSWRVAAWDQVSSAAGPVGAYRIEYALGAKLSGTPLCDGRRRFRDEDRFTIWYAPALGRIVKIDGQGDFASLSAELVAAGGGVAAAPPAAASAPAPAPPPAAKPAPALAQAPAPLRVSVSSPTDQARVTQEDIALAGVASSERGVSRVVVTLNGLEVSRMEEPAARRALAVHVPLKLRQGQNTVAVTATGADGSTQQEVRTVYYERVATLKVDVRYPQDLAKVTQTSSVVAAVASSSRGVASVSITLNGAEVHRQALATPQASVALSVPITLRDGANAVVVSATEPDGTTRQEIRTVFYERPAVAAAPAPAPAAPAPPPAAERWAVVIGVGRYESRDIPGLTYAVSDAEAMYEALVSIGGFKKENVLLLTDASERKPTLRNIKWALGTFLARAAKRDDTVIIYFAGHGAPEVDQRGLERDGLAKYLIPRDADPEDLYSTALPMDELQTIFGRLESERVVAFLDSCFSGAAGGRTFVSKKTRATGVDDIFLERLTRAKGRAIVTASRPAEVSVELPELGHGVFTYYLVQGLRGVADANRDGIVTLQELYEYVEQQVSRKARAVGGKQNPMLKGELEGALPLVKLGRR